MFVGPHKPLANAHKQRQLGGLVGGNEVLQRVQSLKRLLTFGSGGPPGQQHLGQLLHLIGAVDQNRHPGCPDVPGDLIAELVGVVGNLDLDDVLDSIDRSYPMLRAALLERRIEAERYWRDQLLNQLIQAS